MRLNFRVAGAIALVFGVVACSTATDEMTASRSTEVSETRLSVAPSFSPAAASAYSALIATGGDVTNIHVVLTDLGGHVALDMRVAFPATQDTIAIDLPVSIKGREEQFNATIDLLDAAGVVQFSSSQRLTARSSLLPRLPRVAVVLQYVGPGAAAKTVAVSPGDATLLPGATLDVIATATATGGTPLAGLAVVWTSSDTTIARVTQTSAASALVTARGPRGAVTITAKTLSGVVGTAKVTVVPQAGTLSVFSGGGQTGSALDTLTTPFAVELRGTDGGVMSGVLVTFSAVSAGGNVVTATTPTDALGRAATRMVLGRDVGGYTYQAVSGALAPVTVSATATAAAIGPISQLVPLSGLPPGFTVGVTATQKFSGQLADAKGYYVRQAGVVLNATLEITSSSGAKSTQVITTTSDSAGVITLTIPAFREPGTVIITLSVPDIKLTASGTFTIS